MTCLYPWIISIESMETKLKDVSYEFDPAVLSDIHWERLNQISQWGGTDHDDDHFIQDFIRYIDYQLGRGYGEDNQEDGSHNWIMRLRKVAALSIAALESIGRKHE